MKKTTDRSCVYLIGSSTHILNLMMHVLFDNYTPKRGEAKRAAAKDRAAGDHMCRRPGKYQRKQDGKWFCGLHRRACCEEKCKP